MAVNNVSWVYEFGPFLLDCEERVLIRHGQQLALPPKAIETLLVLVTEAGRILGKDELLSRIWPDCFVEEGNLSQAVFQLRKALGESGSKQQYIETVPRRGYRFIAEVRQVPKEDVSNPFDDLPLELARPAIETPSPAEVAPSAVPQALPSAKGRLRHQLILAATVLVLVTVAVAVYLFALSSREPLISFEKMRFAKLTSSGKASHPAVSPDGNYVAYVINEAGRQSIWLEQLASSSGVALVAPAEVAYRGLAFSRNGLSIYFVQTDKDQSLGSLYQIPLIGGTPKRIIADVDSPATLSPDDKRIAFVRHDPAAREFSLVVANANGSDARPLVKRQRPSRIAFDGPSWSPDGKVIAYAIVDSTSGEERMRIATARVADGNEQIIGAESWGWIGQVDWLRNGRGIVCEAWKVAVPVFSDQLWVLSYPGGEVTRFTNDPLSYNRVSLAAKASLAATVRSERNSSLWVGHPGSQEPAQQIRSGFSEHFSEFFGLSWTADGRLLYASQASGNLDLWTMNADGGDQRRLTTDADPESHPLATADGRYLVFVRGRAGANHIWRMDARGGNPTQLTNGKNEGAPSLSPDGRWVIYEAFVEGRRALLKVSIDGGAPMQLTDRFAVSPSVSPDGNSILCLSSETRGGRLTPTIIPAGGGAPQFIAVDVAPDWGQIQWSPDGRGIIYSRTQNGVANLWLRPLDGNAPRQLTDFKEDFIYRFAISSDGRTIACERGRGFKDIILISNFD
jgi:Tol biopolymer transport system component/DNA-binding winged helix-turn-helix (wHTH) protein